MRQVRLAILAGTGILVLCGVAVAASLLDYVSHPGVAVSHVPPVTGAAGADSTGGPTSAPLSTTPVTAAPVDPSPSASPSAPAPQQQPVAAAPASQQSEALAKFLQQHRRRPPRS